MKMFWSIYGVLVFISCLGLSDKVFTECNNYTMDNCELDNDAIIKAVEDISESDCQYHCNTIYRGNCTFFIFDRQQNVCLLVQEELDHYVNSCTKIAGPGHPSLQECHELQDDCKVAVFRDIKCNKIFPK